MPNTRSTHRGTDSDPLEEEEFGDASDMVVDPTVRLMERMFQEMRADRQQMQRLQEERDRAQQDRDRAQEDRDKAMRDLIQRLTPASSSSGAAAGGASGGATGRKAKKVDYPVLGPVQETDMADYRTWRESFEGAANLAQLERECDLAGRQAILRTALDTTWQKLWTTRMLKIDDRDDLGAAMDKIKDYLRAKRSPLLDRRDFYARKQRNGEKLDSYFAELQMLYDSCDFRDDDLICPHRGCLEKCGHGDGHRLREERLRDRLIFGLHNNKVQQKVLEEEYDKLTLERTYNIIQAMESASKTAGDLQGQGSSVDKVDAGRKGARVKSTYKKDKATQQQQQQQKQKPAEKQSCRNCGGHYGKCPAEGQTCAFCKKVGHFARCCQAQKKAGAKGSSGGQREQTLNTVTVEETSMVHKQEKPTLVVSTTIGKKTQDERWLFDSGADVCVISPAQLQAYGRVKRRATDIKLLSAQATEMGEQGIVQATFHSDGQDFTAEVYVVEGVRMPILSFSCLVAMGFLPHKWPEVTRQVTALSLGRKVPRTEILIPEQVDNGVREQMFTEFPLVFPDDQTVEPLKAMTGPPMRIELVPDAKPFKRFKANSIPHYWMDTVKQQLDKMVLKDVIEFVPIGEVGDWVLAMVTVAKAGSSEPRITIDFGPLNPYVKRMGYPTKTPAEEVARIPAGMKFFTTLDGRHGYWQVLLAEECRHLTTFITPWGHYRFKRNAMGLISAGDEHNLRGDRAIEGIDNVSKIVEDIIIYDSDYDTHLKRVRDVLQRCQEAGITLSRKKAKIAQPAVEWCGYTLTAEGYTANQRLNEALQQFPVPKHKTDVRSFCGLVQQFEALSPDLAEMLAPIRPLMSSKAVFQWSDVQQSAFDKVISELCSTRLLAHFRKEANLRLETDAAQKTGFGYALWQEEPEGDLWRLLRCGSRAVSDAESRYSVTESELAAVVYAFKKLKLYVRGKNIQLIVDHKPLVSILDHKGLDEIESPRILRLKEKLRYETFTTVWREGAKHTVADAFSRYPVSSADDDLGGDEDVEDYAKKFTISAASIYCVDQDKVDPVLARVREMTNADQTMIKLKDTIMTGFPNSKANCLELSEYWGVKDKLSVVDDLVLYGKRVVIPTAMRSEVLKELHAAHQGQERVLQRARLCVYWPGMIPQIRDMVRNCKECGENQASQAKEPLVTDVRPTRPGEAVAADLFSWENKEYFVITDKYSGWPEVFEYKRSMTTSDTTKDLMKWFMVLGVPNRITTDNGPQFKSAEFSDFCKKWGIHHDPSSPYHHIANGYAEAAVKSVKTMVKKTCAGRSIGNADFWQAMLEYRNTPRKDGLSPAQRVFGRPMRTKLPSHPLALERTAQHEIKKADRRAANLRQKAKERYDSGAKELPELQVGDIVRVQHHVTKKWDLIAEVVEIKPRGRSYLVRSESGKLYWRNRRYLRRYYDKGEEQGSGSVVNDKKQCSEPVLRRSKRGRKPKVVHDA